MPKQAKKVLEEVEIDDSESDLLGSATDEENESEAGVSEAEGSEACESEEAEDDAPAAYAASSESEDDEVDADEDDDDEEGDDDEEEEDEVEVGDDEGEEDDEGDDEEVEANGNGKDATGADDEEDDDEDDDDDDDEDDDDDDDEDDEDDDDDDDDDDDEDEVDDDEDIPKKTTIGSKKKPEPSPKEKDASLVETVKEQVAQKYESRKGLQLFLRLPEKLPEDYEELEKKVKTLSPLIVKVHKPRQKHARFCLVDFANQEDRDKAFKQLSETSKDSKLVVSLPRTEDEQFLETMVQKRIQKIEKTKAKKLLKKETKKATLEEKFTSTITVYNIPKSASLAQIKELFPDSVDIQLKPAPKKFLGVCTATITCPSTQDARKNQKRKLSLGGNDLIIRFNNLDRKKPHKRGGQGPPKKGPLAPGPLAANGNKQKNKNKPQQKGKSAEEQQKPALGKKRPSGTEGEKQVPEKKAKVTVTTKQPQKKPMQPAKEGKKQNQKKGGPGPNLKQPGKKPFVKKQKPPSKKANKNVA